MKYRFILFTLVAALVFVEVAPILLMYCSGGVWPLNNFEGFDWSLWPPLKGAYAPSFFFNQTGFFYWSILKLIHALTAALVGTRQFSLDYLQTFGYLTRFTYAALMLAVPAIYWWRRRNDMIALLVVAMALALHLATPSIFEQYHCRVSPPLSYDLFTLLIAAATLDATERFLNNEMPSSMRILTWGVLAGATFLEAPHYLLFLLPLFAISIGHLRKPAAICRHVLSWALGAMGGICLGLLLFYGSDWESTLAAVVSLGKGLAGGFAQSQPGFEQFTRMVFNPRSDYFIVHCVLALHVAVMAVFALAAGLSWRRLQTRARYAAVTLMVCFPLVWLLHIRIWQTRGSTTTVFSLVHFGFIACAIALLQLSHIKDSSGTTWPRWIRLATGFAALGFLLPWITTLVKIDYHGRIYSERTTGGAFRSFNAAIDRFPKPIGLAFNNDPSPFLLGSHYVLGGYLHHIGLSWHGEDGRYSARIQQERFPDYRILYRDRATKVSFDYRRWTCQIKIESGWPAVAPVATLAPLPMALGIEYAASVEKAARLVPIEEVPANQDLRRFLLAQPDRGISWQGPARWSIAPLKDAKVRAVLLDQSWPAVWDRSDRIFYLVSAPSGFFVLGLQFGDSPD